MEPPWPASSAGLAPTRAGPVTAAVKGPLCSIPTRKTTRFRFTEPQLPRGERDRSRPADDAGQGGRGETDCLGSRKALTGSVYGEREWQAEGASGTDGEGAAEPMVRCQDMVYTFVPGHGLHL